MFEYGNISNQKSFFFNISSHGHDTCVGQVDNGRMLHLHHQNGRNVGDNFHSAKINLQYVIIH